MKWIITERVHYDRVASCWLIKRFIDQDAQFLFAPRTTPLDQLPTDAIPLAFPGAKLGPHDNEGTLFTHIMIEYQPNDPVLDRLEEIVTGGVRFFLGVPPAPPSPSDVRAVEIGIGLITLADGMQLTYSDDQERLNASYPSWDAMYALLQANMAVCPTNPIVRLRECVTE
jgi:hypothetical protein